MELVRDEDFIKKLAKVVAELKVTCDELMRWAEAKQRQRAEPWQEHVITRLSDALREYERILKE
jgi:uncharacterized coiled-coil protein SlyX